MLQQAVHQSHRPMPQGARIHGPNTGRLAATAARLNRAAPVQRLESSPLAAPLARGTLRAGQVQMQPLRQDLPAREVASLAARTRGIGDRGQRPLVQAVADGRAKLGDAQVQLAPMAPAATGAGLAGSVAALDPRAVQLTVADGRYSLHARLNPWIKVVGGIIQKLDPVTKYNTAKKANKSAKHGGNWHFVTWPVLKKAKIDAHNAIGKQWPPAGGGGRYTIPSGTYDPNARTPGFHALPPSRLPITPPGYAWHQQGGQWQALRDPIQAPASPHFDVHEDVGYQGNQIYRSEIADALSATGRRALGGDVDISTTTYPGARSYPVSTDDYEGPGGQRFGRSHIADHADGTAITTSDPGNFTPGHRIWNEGARNHLVRNARQSGGGHYRESFSYAPVPPRTADGTAIPDTNHFTIEDTQGGQQYYAIPNLTYGNSRSLAEAQQHQQTFGSRPQAKFF